MMLRIEPEDRGERERLRDALAVVPARVLTIRCARGCKIARVGSGPAGIVFRAEPWTIRDRLPSELYVDGKRASRARTVAEQYTDDETVQRLDFTEKHATIAFLGTDAGRVDLLVNCQHGHAILDASTVLEWARKGKAPKVRTTEGERPEYAPLSTGEGEQVRTTVKRHIGGTSVPISEIDSQLGWD